MAISPDVVRRLTVVATERGLTSLKQNLRETDRAFDQVGASATRAATATEAADRRMMALLRQRDRLATAMNAGGIGAVGRTATGDAAASVAAATSRLIPFAAAAAAAVAAYAALNVVIGRGAELLDKYGNAQRNLVAGVDDSLKTLTRFQDAGLTAEQVQRATELGARLIEAKRTIGEFFRVQFGLVDPALQLQAVWVRIVELVAAAAEKLNRVPSWAISMMAGAATGAAIGSVVPVIGTGVGAAAGAAAGLAASLASTSEAKTQSVSLADALTAAYERLRGGMESTSIFAVRFGQAINDLQNPVETVAQSLQKEIAQLRMSEVRKEIDVNLRKAGANAASEEGRLIARLTTIKYNETKAIEAEEKARKEAEATQKRQTEALRRFGEEQNSRMSKLQAERDAIGLSKEATLALKTAEEDLAKLRERGVPISAEMEAGIRRRAKEYADERIEVDKLKESVRDSERLVNSFGGALVEAFTSGGNAAERLVSSLGRIGQQLATTQMNRFLSGQGFGTGSLMSGAGAIGMLGAGAMGYQSGSPLMGALGGAMAGASFGPMGMLAGGAIGGIAGMFGGSAQRRQQQAQMQAQANDINRQAQLAGIDTSTRDGSMQALRIQQQGEIEKAAAERNWASVMALRNLHRAQEVQLEKDWNEREAEIAKQKREEELRLAEEHAKAVLQRVQANSDRAFLAGLDTSTLEGAVLAAERAFQREREAEIEAGGEAMISLEVAHAIELQNIRDGFNRQALEKTKQAEEERLRALNQAARGIVDYLLGLQAGQGSPLSPSARLSAAQQGYNATLGLAQGGNADALGRITQDAETLRTAAQAFYGSSTGYQNIFNQIQQQLLSLPAVQDSEDPTVAALREVVAAVQAGTSTTDTIAQRQEKQYFDEIAGSTDASAAYDTTMISALIDIFSVLNSFPTYYTSMISAMNATASATATQAQAQAEAEAKKQAEAEAFRRSEEERYNRDFAAWQFKVGPHGGFSSIPTSNNYLAPPIRANYKFAEGGLAPANSMFMYGEHHPQGPFFGRTGSQPIAITPNMPVMGMASNDNGAVVARIAALERALTAALDRLALVTAAGAEHVREGVDDVVDETRALVNEAKFQKVA